MTIPIRMLLWSNLIVVLGITLSAAEGVSITVKKRSRPGGAAAYQYTVINKSKETIASVAIGRRSSGQDMELDVFPLGWDGAGSPIPTKSASSPPHWKPMVVTQEESAKVSIEWQSAEETFIKPGEVLTGFEIVLEKASNAYLSSHWMVTTTSSKALSGVLKPSM